MQGLTKYLTHEFFLKNDSKIYFSQLKKNESKLKTHK